MERVDWQKWSSVTVCLAAAATVIFLAVKYLLGILLPFALAWAVALITARPSEWVSKKTGIPRKFCSIVLLVAILAIIVISAAGIVRVLTDEIRRLISELSAERGGVADILTELFSALDRIYEGIPSLGGIDDRNEMNALGEKLDGIIADALGRLLGELSAFLPSAAMDIIGKLPKILILVGVTLISCVYFCLDSDSIHKSIMALLPKRLSDGIPRAKERFFSVIWKWTRAYMLLFLLSFVQLYIGFLILGVDYALSISIVVAAVDMLPVLGTGTVLIPWGIFSLLTGNFRLGFGLLILYAVITLVRQIAEPKIVGQSLGIHPILTLVAMYGGLRLAGVWGMMLFPLVLVIIKGMISTEVVGET